MFKLTTPTSLPLLNLPASALATLSNEILGPVDDIDLFTAFWNETGTLLWHLNHDDTPPKTRCWQWHWLTRNTSPHLMMAGISCSVSSAITDRVSIWCSRTRPLSLNSGT
ncbi:Uncharacterised protein [Escherichia coli]|uniref:Uncharacterized protein n=1 Tax=Escherichia coli TaxID=562 RepID=A0A377C009_ECOLX|nr:Uncharacterised protein [Escherichia coli]